MVKQMFVYHLEFLSLHNVKKSKTFPGSGSSENKQLCYSEMLIF